MEFTLLLVLYRIDVVLIPDTRLQGSEMQS